jgi:hypothetical protein
MGKDENASTQRRLPLSRMPEIKPPRSKFIRCYGARNIDPLDCRRVIRIGTVAFGVAAGILVKPRD